MWTDRFDANRWYNRANSNETTLLQQYGTPRGWYRRSYFGGGRRDDPDAIRDELLYIRAAAIFPKGRNLTVLTNRPSYSMVANLPHKDWQIIIVSVDEPLAWLQEAYSIGAQAWWLADPGPVFRYVPVVYPSPQEETGETGYAQGAGNYDREQVIRDLKSGTMTQQAIADRYGITKSMVNIIARELRSHPRTSVNAQPRQIRPVDPAKLPDIIADINSGQMTKDMIALKHGIHKNSVTTIVIKYNLIGRLPRGHYAAQLSLKKQKTTA